MNVLKAHMTVMRMQYVQIPPRVASLVHVLTVTQTQVQQSWEMEGHVKVCQVFNVY